MSVTASPWAGQIKQSFGYACATYERGCGQQVSSGGSADLATGSDFTLQTRVNCGSIGKLATAYFVTRIWSRRNDRDKLRIGALIPGIPSPLADATVEECLTHTSGLWDFRSLIPLFGERSTFAYGLSDTFELAVKQRSLVPGFRRQYSNTNYLLLGAAVERETGAGLQDLVTEWLGSDVGNFVFNPRVVVPKRARGYEVTENGNVLEFGQFVDGRGSTNFWANGEELSAFVERVTDGFANRPAYGGLPMSDGTFYAAGQDGGFRAAAVIDTDNGRCHVALTNDPALYPPEIMDKYLGLRIDGAGNANPAPKFVAGGLADFEGTFACSSLGVLLAIASESDGNLVASVGDRVLGRLGRESPDSFSDGHIYVFKQGDTKFLSINHAVGIPLERVAV
jgi:hypothetical protein